MNRLLFQSGFINYWILGSVLLVLKTPFPHGELCEFTGFPNKRPGWWGIDREPCEFTGFATRGQASGLLTGNHVNLHDSPRQGW